MVRTPTDTLTWIKSNTSPTVYTLLITCLVISVIVTAFSNYTKIFNWVVKFINAAFSRKIHLKSQLSSFDEKKLSELSEKYTGDGYLYFFEMLEDRKINEHQLNKYEEQMTRFSAAHKSFRNKKREAAKNQFFDSLRDLIQFSFIHFNQYGSSHILIFRGTSEDDKKLVELGRNISKQWEGLHKIVAKLHPEFNWPDNMEVEVAD